MAKFAFACNEEGLSYCGTDAYFPIDGRYNNYTATIRARAHFKSLKQYIHKEWYGFIICCGSILDPHPLTKINKINE